MAIDHTKNQRAFERRTVCLLLMFAAVLFGLLFPFTASANAHDDYKELVVDIENEGPPQQIQLYRVDSNGDRITGICNVCSITTLLNRRLVYDGKTDEEFTVNDVFDACGVSVKAGPIYWNGNGKTGYRYSGDTGYWSRLKYKNDYGTSYQAVRVSVDEIKDGVNSAGSFSNYLINLLHKHPEGICIRNEAANHVAVIYYYAIIDGKVQFYVKDPVERYSGKVEDAWIYNANGVHSLYNGIDFIVYLKGSRSAPEPDESCRVYSAMSRGSSGTQVKSMQKMLNAVMDAHLDPDGYFGPGTEELLKRFQRTYGLDDDGICGKGTWGKLKEEYAKLDEKDRQSAETKESPEETKETPQETKETPQETKETTEETKETPQETKESPQETKESSEDRNKEAEEPEDQSADGQAHRRHESFWLQMLYADHSDLKRQYTQEFCVKP